MTRYLLRSLVSPFFRENGGLIIFIYTMTVFIVNSQSGAGVYEYHLFLVLGTFRHAGMMATVFLLWLLYTRKFTAFVVNEIYKPENAFLNVFNYLSRKRKTGILFIATFLLMIPVWAYVVFMVITGVQYGYIGGVLLIIGYLLLLCFLSALWLEQRLRYIADGKTPVIRSIKFTSFTGTLLRYVATKQLVTWAGLKIFTCGLLFLIAVNNPMRYYDGQTIFIVVSLGILGNGVLVYRCREFEDVYLNFYRTMPVGLNTRLLEYALLDLILIIPEIILLVLFVPKHMPLYDAVTFSLCGYGSMLLMTSLTFYRHFTKSQFYKLLSIVLCIQYIFLMTVGLPALYIALTLLAIIIFRWRYYKYETLLP
ncbi:hypothetical protein [Chitinophaga silvisoli]|uniref:Uncharacterized protein n=1 Tax=Chitinophaga silvisoli TaxID=2291814 RepID=A0A3E1NYL4_9BACT|nr:hypothetical protein [Chitinophaga silvisoli]RFM32985.1 hypothetical protein DXN04_21360 [Chitinophaga silvisoli]